MQNGIFAHYGVERIGVDIDDADGRAAQPGGRQLETEATRAALIEHVGLGTENGNAGFVDGAAQDGIVGKRVSECRIEGHDACARALQIAQQLRVPHARPGIASEGIFRFDVDGDDRYLDRPRCCAAQCEPAIVNAPLERAAGARFGGQNGERRRQYHDAGEQNANPPFSACRPQPVHQKARRRLKRTTVSRVSKDASLLSP